MESLFLIGRIVFGSICVYWGLNHFLQLEATTGYARYKGLPAPKLAVVASGLMLLAGGLSIVVGFQTIVGSWLLILFFVPAAITAHNFWTQTDPMARASEKAHFLKNMVMAAAALMISTLSSVSGWPTSLGG